MMGGSGGGEGLGSERLDQLRKWSIERIREEELDSAVNQFLGQQLAASTRNADAVRDKLNGLALALGDAIDGRIDLLFGGSVAKHTYVDGLSDIDTLAIVDRPVIGGDSPAEVIRSFADAIRGHSIPDVRDVKPGRLAVTVSYADGSEIQILPAMRRGDAFVISRADGLGWSAIRPDRFATKLAEANTELAGRLVPTIKLAKSIISQFPETRQISGYHAESLAIEAFRDYQDRRTPKEMLTHFFKEASERVLAPIRDSTGQSVHVDDDLGEAGSLERRLVSDSMARTERRLRYATSLTQWEAMFSE